MTYSLTYVGVIVMVLSEVLRWLGLEVGSEQLTTTVLTILQVLGAITAFFGRWRAGGITILGTRK